MQKLQKDILNLLRRNARISNQEIADRLDSKVEKIDATIKKMEEQGLILGYTAIVAEEAEQDVVRAIIEVQIQPERDSGFDNLARKLAKFPEVVAAHLVSGRYDLRLEVLGKSLQEIASFVSDKLASQDGVKSTATYFLLKKYKEAGLELAKEETHERLKVTP
ncbi:MAG: Lrp/AsnC family transcriptional regulator [Oligosphaeraceae bacterium]|nr:Lrp/AsnC family transcriptional regulator [Oligosphaeraceae bacterium]